MSNTPIQWVINKAHKKIYAVSHAKAVIRGNSTVDADLTRIENSLDTIDRSYSETQSKIDSIDLDSIRSHRTVQVASSNGVHGIRYYNNRLQYMPDGSSQWSDLVLSNTGISLGNMGSFEVYPGTESGQAVLCMQDPDDVVADEVVLAHWAGTIVRRKTTGYPTGPDDGELVISYSNRNQYVEGYTDTGLSIGTTYYYRCFPYTSTGAVTLDTDDWPSNRGSITISSVSGIRTLDIDWSTKVITTGGSPVTSMRMYTNRRMCMVAHDGTIIRYKGQSGFSTLPTLDREYYIDNVLHKAGEPVELMVYQPRVYYRIMDIGTTTSTSGQRYLTHLQVYLSDVKRQGYTLHPAFMHDGEELPYLLLSAYETSFDSTNRCLRSVVGAMPANSGSPMSPDNLDTYSSALGAGWSTSSVLTMSLSQLLFLAEYGTFNSDTLSTGNMSSSTTLTTGRSYSYLNSVGTGSHQEGATSGSDTVSYRYEENLWGNTWCYLSGAVVDCSTNQATINVDHNWEGHSSGIVDDIVISRTSGMYRYRAASDGLPLSFLPSGPVPDGVGSTDSLGGDSLIQAYGTAQNSRIAQGGGPSNGVSNGLFAYDTTLLQDVVQSSLSTRLVYYPNNQ